MNLTLIISVIVYIELWIGVQSLLTCEDLCRSRSALLKKMCNCETNTLKIKSLFNKGKIYNTNSFENHRLIPISKITDFSIYYQPGNTFPYQLGSKLKLYLFGPNSKIKEKRQARKIRDFKSRLKHNYNNDVVQIIDETPTSPIYQDINVHDSQYKESLKDMVVKSLFTIERDFIKCFDINVFLFSKETVNSIVKLFNPNNYKEYQLLTNQELNERLKKICEQTKYIIQKVLENIETKSIKNKGQSNNVKSTNDSQFKSFDSTLNIPDMLYTTNNIFNTWAQSTPILPDHTHIETSTSEIFTCNDFTSDAINEVRPLKNNKNLKMIEEIDNNNYIQDFNEHFAEPTNVIESVTIIPVTEKNSAFVTIEESTTNLAKNEIKYFKDIATTENSDYINNNFNDCRSIALTIVDSITTEAITQNDQTTERSDYVTVSQYLNKNNHAEYTTVDNLSNENILKTSAVYNDYGSHNDTDYELHQAETNKNIVNFNNNIESTTKISNSIYDYNNEGLGTDLPIYETEIKNNAKSIIQTKQINNSSHSVKDFDQEESVLKDITPNIYEDIESKMHSTSNNRLDNGQEGHDQVTSSTEEIVARLHSDTNKIYQNSLNVNGKMYFKFNNNQIPASFTQDNNGEISVGIDGFSLCEVLLRDSGNNDLVKLLCINKAH